MWSVRLARRNASGNAFRSWTVFVCAAIMAASVISTTVVIGGAQNSLNLARERLGADIIVVPTGSEDLMENAFLMGVPARVWMPQSVVDRVAAVPGVQIVSPQLFLATLRGATCCSVPEMFLVAYDPATDFTLRPWLEQNLTEGLRLGQAIGGSLVYVPADPGAIFIYGYEVDLKGNLGATGTGIDQSMFLTFETAREIARLSTSQAVQPLVIPADSVSAAMVKTRPGTEPPEVARRIREAIPGVTPVDSTSLFDTQRVQITGLLQSVVALMVVAWLLFVALVGLVYSMAINERRQEIGVLRALGFRRGFVLRTLLAEGLILAAGGAGIGIALSTGLIYLFHDAIVQKTGLPFLIPSATWLFLLALLALSMALASVTVGAMVPTLRISLLDPTVAMRE